MRRIHYVPGLLSLALMLPLGLWYFQSQRAFREERCINMLFPHPPDPESLFTYLEWQPDPKDSVPDYDLDGCLMENLNQLNEFRSRVSALVLEKDRFTTLHIRFGPRTKYAVIMHAVESCRLHTQSWSLDGFDLWTFYVPRYPAETSSRTDRNTVDQFCGTQYVVQKPSIAQWFKERIVQPIWPLRNIWPALPLYVALVIFDVRRFSRAPDPAQGRADRPK